MELIRNIVEKFNNTATTYDKIWITVGFFGICWVIFQAATGSSNINPNQPIYAPTPTPQIDTAVCPLTKQEDLLKTDHSPLNTITQIASINFDTKVADIGLTKNSVEPISNPTFTDIESMQNCLLDNSQVLVIDTSSVTKIYPLSILIWHQLVNDEINEQPIIVTYCLLCNYYNVYSREVKDKTLEFGNSGLFYKNSMLMFDQETESLWSPFTGEALVGEYTGGKLASLKFSIMDWKSAKENFPTAKVLSTNTGFIKNYAYQFDPQAEIKTINETENPSNEAETQAQILGFFIDQKPFAIGINKLGNKDKYTIKRGEEKIEIKYIDGSYKVKVNDKSVQSYQSYWYTWYDNYPSTIIF